MRTRRFITKRRIRRDPVPLSTSKTARMSQLLHNLMKLDSPNTGVAGFRTGTNVYISLTRIDDAFILADALEEEGYAKLGKSLSSFARGVIRAETGKQFSRRVTTTPSWEKWRSLVRKIKEAIHDMREKRYRQSYA